MEDRRALQRSWGPAPATSPTGDLLKAGTKPEDGCLQSMVTAMVRGGHEDLVRNVVGAWVSPSSPMVCAQWGSDL